MELGLLSLRPPRSPGKQVVSGAFEFSPILPSPISIPMESNTAIHKVPCLCYHPPLTGNMMYCQWSYLSLKTVEKQN